MKNPAWYEHTLRDETGHFIQVIIADHEGPVFGKPDVDYDSLYSVTIEALFKREKPHLNDDDAVLVPRGLLGAAAHAIDKGRRGENTLAKIREYARTSGQPNSAHELNESTGFENYAFEQGWPTHKSLEGDYVVQSVALAEKAWLARAARARSILLPERDKVVVGHTLWVDDPKSYTDVWNAALDEVSRLNGIS